MDKFRVINVDGFLSHECFTDTFTGLRVLLDAENDYYDGGLEISLFGMRKRGHTFYFDLAYNENGNNYYDWEIK